MKKTLFLFIVFANLDTVAVTPRNYSQKCIRISREAIQLASMSDRRPFTILQQPNKTKCDRHNFKTACKIVRAKRSYLQKLKQHFCGKKTDLQPEEITAFIIKYRADQWPTEQIIASLSRKINRAKTAIACFKTVLETDGSAVVAVADQHLLPE